MIAVYKELAIHQFDAALCMLHRAVDRCPDDLWDSPVANHRFCQVAFHTLFFTDLYLGVDPDALRAQAFHLQHSDFFGDYEELEDRAPQRLYTKPSLETYLTHCRDKATDVIAGESAESLAQKCGFDWLDFSRAELHAYNVRHIQHHVGQLSLRLRIDAGDGVPWVRFGWPQR